MVTLSYFWRGVRFLTLFMLIGGILGFLVFDLFQLHDENHNNLSHDVLYALIDQPDSVSVISMDNAGQDVLVALGVYEKIDHGLPDDYAYGPPYIEYNRTESDSAKIAKRLEVLVKLYDYGLRIDKEDDQRDFIKEFQEMVHEDSIGFTGWQILEQYYMFGNWDLDADDDDYDKLIEYWRTLGKSFLPVENYFRLRKYSLRTNEGKQGEVLAIFRQLKDDENIKASVFIEQYFLLRYHSEMISSQIAFGSLFSVLEDEPQKVIKAALGTLEPGEIPESYDLKWHEGKKGYMIAWFLFFNVMSFLLGYLPKCYGWGYYNRNPQKFYDIEWGRPIVYLFILLWLPGILVYVIPWGIIKLLFTDHAKVRRERETREALEAELNFVPEPEPEPVIGHDAEAYVEPHSEPAQAPAKKPEPVVEEIKFKSIWFFVDNNRLTGKVTKSSFQNLAKRGIAIASTQIGKDDETRIGITFPAEHWQHVYREFGIKPINIRKYNSGVENIVIFEFDDPQGFLAEKQTEFNENRDEQEAQFIAECRRAVQQQIDAKEVEIDTNNADVTKAVSIFATLNQKNEVLNREISALAEAYDQDQYSEMNLKKSFEQICSMAHVAAISVEDGMIRVYTDELFIKFKKKTYRMGEYEIAINTETNNVEWKNLFHAYSDGNDKVHHPYGTCLGNIADGVAQLLAKHDYVNLIHVLIKFLQTVHGDYAKYLKYWEVVSDESV